MQKAVGKIGAATVRERSFSRSLTVAAPIFPLAFVFFAAGCESGFGTRIQGDPMLGIHAAPKPLPAPGAPSNALAQATSGPIPPMPPSYTAPSTAPVAGGETAAPENPRDLRMPGDTVSPASLSSAGAARGVAPAVNVGSPEPAPVGTTARSATAPVSGGLGSPALPPPGGSAANIRSYEDAQQFLKQHGVTWQRMSQDEGEWKFACGIPNPSNPHVNKTYQTSRPFPDLLSAMRAVIAQIEQTPR